MYHLDYRIASVIAFIIRSLCSVVIATAFFSATAAAIKADIAILDKWEASNLSELNDGDSVGTWLSMEGRPAQGAAGEQPVLVTHATPTGKPAVYFAGDLLTAAQSPVAGHTNFSIILVFRATEPGVDRSVQWWGKTGIIDAEQPGFTEDWGVVIDESGQLGFGTGSSDTSTYYTKSGSLVDGHFHATAVMWGNGEQKLIVDEMSAVSQRGASTLPRSDAGFSFGGIHTGEAGKRFSGYIAEARFYAKALTENEARDVIAELTQKYIVGNSPFIRLFEAEPKEIFLGDNIRLSWNTTNCASLILEPGFGHVQTPRGELELALETNTTFTLFGIGNNQTNSAHVTVTVNPGKPIADPQSIQTTQNESVTIELTGADPNKEPLTYSIHSPPAHGQLHGTPPNLQYVPDTDYTGNDSFEFTVNDGHTESAPAAVVLRIIPAPTAPTDIIMSTSAILPRLDKNETVALVRAIDPNITDIHTFEILPIEGAAPPPLDIVNGEIRTTQEFTGDPGKVLSFKIRASDQLGMTLDKYFSLSVNDDKPGIIINEIHYNPELNTVPAEFIELYNTRGTAVDLSGWSFDGAIHYIFPEGSIIPPGGYLVISQSPETIMSKHEISALGPWEGKLNNEGENVQLYDATRNSVDAVDYRSVFPWPIAANGEGGSMELIHPRLDNNLGSSWKTKIPDTIQQPEVFISESDDTWRLRKGTNEPSTTLYSWTKPEFVEDDTWRTIETPVGYGDNDDRTVLGDMPGNYTTAYLRHTFLTDSNAVPSTLDLRLYVDDGAIIWINGKEVLRRHVSSGEKRFDDVTGAAHHEREWENIRIMNAWEFLVPGRNVLAVQVLNTDIDSSDLSFDLELKEAAESNSLPRPSPGRRNAVYSFKAAPNIRQVNHNPERPGSDNTCRITAKVTDPEGVESVTLEYQLLPPGGFIPSYIPLTPSELQANPSRNPESNPEYSENWQQIEMLDDGIRGDNTAGDDYFTAIIPAQSNRTVVRYRIIVRDKFGAERRAPFEDDPSLNFAYFVYDGIPDYQGVSPEALTSLPVYFLIARAEDIRHCTAYNAAYQLPQFVNGQANEARFVYNWPCAFVYDGIVYDNIKFRLRGANGRYQPGKRNWRFNFNKGKFFEARDQNGKKYPTAWSHLTTGKGQSNHETLTFGFNEIVNYYLFRNVGVPAPAAHFFHFRVVDDAEEAPDKYRGDFWGISWAQERYDVRFLEAHGLPKGNLYKLINSKRSGLEQRRYQAPNAVNDGSDLENIEDNLTGFKSTEWLREHVNYTNWFRYHAVCEAVRHYDFWPSANKNAGWYFEPIYTAGNNYLGRMMTFPWDTDSTWGPTWNLGHDVVYNGIFPSSAAGGDQGENPELQKEYRNTIREVRDLLIQPDQINPILDAFAAQIRPFINADLSRWSNAPPGTGSYSSLSSPGPALYQGIDGYVEDMKKFMFSGGWWPGGGVSAGGQSKHMDAVAYDPDIPDTPVLMYTGADDFPVDNLVFSSSAFSDPQGGRTFDAIQWRAAEVLPENSSVTNPANLKLEWDAVWDSGELNTFNSTIKIPPATLLPDHLYRVRVRHKDDTDRWSHWSEPIEFRPRYAPTVGDAKTNLVISEIMYHPPALNGYDGDEFEFLELRNIGHNTINLGGLQLIDGIEYTFPLDTSLEPGGFFLLVENAELFGIRYPDVHIDGVFTKNLGNAGDIITLFHPHEGALWSIEYGDDPPWPVTADGLGFSLVLDDPQKMTFKAGSHYLGTPGAENQPTPFKDILITEILSNTGSSDNDFIEIQNRSTNGVDIGGWYLSDNKGTPRKFRIPTKTILEPDQFYMVSSTEYDGANTNGFGLASAGEEVYLFSANAAGELTGYSHGFNFDAAPAGIPYGIIHDSVGTEHVIPLKNSTPAMTNSNPNLGPVIINEFFCDATAAGDAFVELKNTGTNAVPLFIRSQGTNFWRIDGLGFSLDQPITLPPSGLLLLVDYDAGLFRIRHRVPTDAQILEYPGKLKAEGETLAVQVPFELEPGRTAYYPSDRVEYRINPGWPPPPASSPMSFHRMSPNIPGSFPENWETVAPSPGRDGVDVEAYNFGKLRISLHSGSLFLNFGARTNRNYYIGYTGESLSNPDWQLLEYFMAAPTNRILWITNSPVDATRFYRLFQSRP
ncbi:MAG: lamin tail domain-containing protein [Verrucomicrobia bacterium]|nr:lamin tail domain-containing protein [Verrucomicrobiota bacterium]